jgi:hypothetical protein
VAAAVAVEDVSGSVGRDLASSLLLAAAIPNVPTQLTLSAHALKLAKLGVNSEHISSRRPAEL